MCGLLYLFLFYAADLFLKSYWKANGEKAAILVWLINEFD